VLRSLAILSSYLALIRLMIRVWNPLLLAQVSC